VKRATPDGEAAARASYCHRPQQSSAEQDEAGGFRGDPRTWISEWVERPGNYKDGRERPLREKVFTLGAYEGGTARKTHGIRSTTDIAPGVADEALKGKFDSE
jgi:hypothetical protein